MPTQVITHTTTGNRALVEVLYNLYRLYFWFLSGPGFLTVLTKLSQTLFCTDDIDGDGNSDAYGMRVLTDRSIVCWSSAHVRMVGVSLLCLAFFLPSAALTTPFRYPEDDQIGIPPYFVMGGCDMRFLHMWRRVEYTIKGIWVYSGLSFVAHGNFACLIILLGSLAICIL